VRLILNVLMLLPGEDENLKNEYVIIGAHFDHLGMGGPGSSSRAVDTVGVHHGADDNASGVAGILELAALMTSERSVEAKASLTMAITSATLYG